MESIFGDLGPLGLIYISLSVSLSSEVAQKICLFHLSFPKN